MKLFRSKSCVLKGKSERPQQHNPDPKPQAQASQQLVRRRFSLQTLKNRSKQKAQKQKSYMKVFKQRILNYIELRSDVEIINFYSEYKEEFFRKSINLQNLLYQQQQIRAKYLSQDNAHFYKGFQQTLLSLFRRKVIVPGEFKNMRLETVEEIEKWVFSWVQRQMLYEKAVEEDKITVKETECLMDDIQSYNKMVQNEAQLF